MERPPYHLRLLGDAEVTRTIEGESPLALSPGKPLALLAYVALAAEPPSRDELAVLLWPDSSRQRARGSLRQALWQLRKVLGEEIFAGDDPVTLSSELLEVDAHTFRELLTAGDLEGALELWQGPPLGELHIPDAPEWERWVDEVRRELEQRLAGGLSDRGNRERETGQGRDAVRWLRKARSVQPYRLQHHLDLAEALLDLRRFDDAERALAGARQQFEDSSSMAELDAMEDRIQAVRRGATDGAAQTGSGMRLRFTGRTEEFAGLARRWRYVREGDTGMALILGEAGIGKTRLAEELALLARSEGGRVVKIKAEDSERPIEWGLVGELVESLLRLSGAAGIASGSADMLRTLVPSLPTGSETPSSPRADGRGLALPRTRPSAALSDALQDLVAAVAEDAPLVVLLDDLQWADTESRAVLTRVATRMSETPVLFLATSRTEAGEVSPRMRKTLALLAEGAGEATFELQPLTETETRELLEGTIEAPDGAQVRRVVDRIIRTSRGNPLFIVELLKVLQDEGVLTEADDGRWVLSPEHLPTDFPLPASLKELIDRQLANLSQEASLVAAHLASARHAVSPRVLASRAGLGPAALTAGVGELTARRMVQWEPGEKLAFVHDELRAAVSRRFQLHVGLTTGGGTQWSLFRTAVAASLALLLMSAAAYFVTGGSFPSAPSLGGGPILIVHGSDSVLEARGPFNAPAGNWRIQAAALNEWDGILDASWPGGPLDNGPGAPFASDGDTRELKILPTPQGSDSALVVRPDGGVVDERSWERIFGASWCGGTPPSLLLSVQDGGETRLLHWRPEASSATEVPLDGLPGTILACAPDGRYGAVLVANQGDLSVHVLDLRSGSGAPLPLDDPYRVQSIVWHSDRPAPFPAAVRIRDVTEKSLDWGERELLSAMIEHSDGGVSSDGIHWESRDPGVAAVSPQGILTANRPGRTWVVASFDGWLSDSIPVTVREAESAPRVLLWDPVPPLADEVWESQATRSISGDDGGSPAAPVMTPPAWRSVDGFDLPAGGTLEMDFALSGEGPPLRACLTKEEDGTAIGSTPAPQALLCVVLTVDEDRVIQGQLHFHPSFPPLPLSVGPVGPEAGSRWRHLGLALLPDGTGAAFLDRTEVVRTPARLPLEGHGRWHVTLDGIQLTAEGGDSARGFRNVLLWPDVRF
jgi:DNA-binding SARP family transcriptional activator